MARIEKYNAYSVGRVLLHNNREYDDGVQHSNEDINPDRTMFNYHLKSGNAKDAKDRLSELFVLKKSDTTVMGEVVVTLPKDVKEEDERDFFEAVYDFYSNDFGEKNIINAVVHKDESTPHVHIDFIPVLKGEPEMSSVRGKAAIEKWKAEHDGEMPKERVCCKELISRQYLSQMHARLSKYVKDRLGYEVEILNGATANGNRTVLRLKEDSLKEEIEKMEKLKAHLGKEIGEMLTVAKQNGLREEDIGLYPLVQRIADLKNQNEILKNIITRQGYNWKREDLLAMKKKAYDGADSAKVNVYEGSLSDAVIEDNAFVIIELPNKIPRRLPQQKLIDGNADLERQVRFASASAKPVTVKPSRINDQIYIFIKTDSVKQTLENILLLESQLKEMDMRGRKVYMERLQMDEYDFARSVLIKDQIDAAYFINSETAIKEKDNELEIVKEK